MKRRYKKIKRNRCYKTGKVEFTEEDARRIVKNSESSQDSNRKESRYYFCHECGNYHLTKMSKVLYNYKTDDEILAEEESRQKANLSFKNKWLNLIKKNQNEEK